MLELIHGAEIHRHSHDTFSGGQVFLLKPPQRRQTLKESPKPTRWSARLRRSPEKGMAKWAKKLPKMAEIKKNDFQNMDIT